MIEFLNPFTGTIFGVTDDRVNEYKAAGFVPVADLEKPQVNVKKVEEPEEEPKKTTTKRATKKK